MRAGEKNYEDMLDSFSEDVRKAVDNASSISIEDEIENVVIFGLGVEGVIAKLVKDYFKEELPIAVVNSELPKWVNSKTLVFVLTFKGGDEAVDIYRTGLRKGAKIIVISCDSKLETLCTKQGRKYVKIPYGVEEKEALPYFFFSIISILHNSGLVKDQSVFVKDVIRTLEKKDVFIKKGIELSKRMRGKVPLIYASPEYNSIAKTWKVLFNNIANIHCFTNSFPEVLYSELNAFKKLNGYYYVVVIRDADANMKSRKMFEDFRGEVKSNGVDILEIGITGGSYLTKLFSAVYMGMWAAYYLSQDIVE
jgi:hypothetical protein